MARRKSAQNTPKKRPNRKSIIRASKFPAERLPSELIHMIFTYLDPKEAAAFRFVGKAAAEIGLQYLVPTVYLALNEESYDRLLAIAKHPIFSKYVVMLEYETEGLRFMDRNQWDSVMISTTTEARPVEKPDIYASARAWRAYDRGRETTKALNRAWQMYEAYHASQKKVQQALFFPEKTAEAMKHLPNLTTISASGDGAYRRYVAEMKDLLPKYHVRSSYACERQSIVDTTSSILSAAESAGLRCHHFLSQPISLRIFRPISDNTASLKKSMLHLKTMKLDLTVTQRGREIDSIEIGILRKDSILDFVTSAPNLQHLSLAFNMEKHNYAEIPFNKTIGGFYWPSLKALSLVSLCSYEYELWNFFERHARTLKHVSLKDMRLYEGLWPRTFEEMRRIFAFGQQLNTCRLSGYFSSPAVRTIHIVGTVTSDYVQATDFEDISLEEYCQAIGVPPLELSKQNSGTFYYWLHDVALL